MGSSESSFEKNEKYLLCSNGSILNYTGSSIFCNESYPFPIFNPTDNFNDELIGANDELEKVVSFVVPFLFSIIFILGLFGNALVVLVVASNRNMRSTTNLLIINLAVADLLFIIFCVPFTATDYVLSYWPFGLIWCKTVQYLIIVTAYASVLTLVLMSFDRFLAVIYPVASISIRTESNALGAIAITWIIILLSCLPAFLAHGLEVSTYGFESSQVCTFLKSFNHSTFQLLFLLTSYALPLLLISFLYLSILFRLSSSSSSKQSARGKRRVTRMVVVVVGVFTLCWLPIQVVLLLKSHNVYPINDLTIGIQITAHVLGYMNSCVNPILYAFLSENFRKAFRKIIGCKTVYNPIGVRRCPTESEQHLGNNENTHVQNPNIKETVILANSFKNGGGHRSSIRYEDENQEDIL